MRYSREQLRDFIKCPQLGSTDYGEWGALRLEQRIVINDLLDQLDSAEGVIEQLKKENEELKQGYKLKVKQMVEYRDEHYVSKCEIRKKIGEYLEWDRKHKRYTCNGKECFTFEYFYAKEFAKLLKEGNNV